MKYHISCISLYGLTFAICVASALTAHASNCRNSTLNGEYAFTIHGQILPPAAPAPLLVDGIAKTSFDGKGNLTQVDTAPVNGNVAPGWRPGSGTYSVSPDCTGTMTIVNQGMAPLELQIVIGQSGNTLHAVVITPGFAITSDAERTAVEAETLHPARCPSPIHRLEE